MPGDPPYPNQKLVLPRGVLPRRALPRGVLYALGAALLAAGLTAGCFLPAAVAGDVKKLVDGRAETTPIAKLCGNGVCDTHRFETCAHCPVDCGRCEGGAPDLMALVPESGPAKRWVSIFGHRLGAVQRLWIVPSGQDRQALRHRRRGTALQVYIPANSSGGVIHIQVRGQVRATHLSYSVHPG